MIHRVIYGVVLLLLIGCSKRNISEIPADNVPRKDGWLSRLKKMPLKPYSINTPKYSDPQNINGLLDLKKLSGSPDGNDAPNPIAGTYPSGPGEVRIGFNKRGEEDPEKVLYRQGFRSNVFVVEDQAMSLNIFPGAILHGSSLSKDGALQPSIPEGISNHVRPINISTSLPVSGSVVSRTLMARPSNDRAFVRAALTDLEKLNAGRVGAARLQVEKDSFTVYEELKTLYGYNKNIDIFIVDIGSSGKSGSHKIRGNAGVKVKFFQQNFTIDVDVPSGYNELFDPTGLDSNKAFGGYSPYYVSSVTYGRMGIMTIESSGDATTLFNAVNKQVNILRGVVGVETRMTEKEINILNGADMKVKLAGVGLSTDKPAVVTGLKGFIETLSANATFSKADPGIPISFRLRYLSDDTNVEAPFAINYGSFDKPYARIEYRNWEDSRISETPTPGKNWHQITASVSFHFYTDASAQGAYKEAPNFINFIYRRNRKGNIYTSYSGNSTNNYADTSSIRNKLKGTFITLADKTPVSLYDYRPDKNGGTSYVIYKYEIYYELVPNDFYHILPTIGEKSRLISIGEPM